MSLPDVVDVIDPANLPNDSHGNPVMDWSNAVSEPAQVHPLILRHASEVLGGQDIVTSKWRITLLPVTTATPLSRIRWRGDVYEVEGAVQLATDTRGNAHHSMAMLTRVTG